MTHASNRQAVSSINDAKKRRTRISILDREDYDQTAKAVLDARMTTDGHPHVCLRAGELYVWNGLSYRYDRDYLEQVVWRALAEATVQTERETSTDGVTKIVKVSRPYNPNINRVSNVCRALLRTLCPDVPYMRAPHWIGDSPGMPPASEMVPFANGLVHVRTGKLYPHTPKFFCLWSSPVTYDPTAECPVWDRFQASVYKGRQDNIDLLEEWFGYCMIGYDGEQKFLYRQGRPGGGKGVEWRVLEQIIGPGGLTSIALNQLGGDDKHATAFLQDKSVVVMPDASMERGAETRRTLAMVKQLSGSDGLTVRGMGRANNTDKSYAKVYIVTNKFTPMPDEALPRRILFQKSDIEYAGTPTKAAHAEFDPHLDRKLSVELAGIANRCIRGVGRMLERGKFVQPAYGKNMLANMLDRMDDLSVFLRRHFVLDAGARTPMCDVIDAFNYLYKKAEGLHYDMKPAPMGDRISELYAEDAVSIKSETRAKSVVGDSPSGYVVIGLAITRETAEALLPIVTDGDGKRKSRRGFITGA
jgi:putative DNA primase/helicase